MAVDQVHSYTLGIGADATVDGQRMSVPEDMGNRHWQMLLAWHESGNEWPAPPPLPDLTPVGVPMLCCLANLSIAGFDIAGIDTATGMSTAFMIDVGVAWVFFGSPMTNLNYSWNVNSSVGRANVTGRALEYIVISITDNDGNPAESADLSLQIFKVN